MVEKKKGEEKGVVEERKRGTEVEGNGKKNKRNNNRNRVIKGGKENEERVNRDSSIGVGGTGLRYYLCCYNS